MLDRPDVDRQRIVSIGVGQAGYLLPRALAYEHRLAAAVVAPGLVDVTTAWFDALPPRLQRLLQDHEHTAFDRELRIEFLLKPQTERHFRAAALPYCCGDAQPSRIFSSLNSYRLDLDLTSLRTPLLVLDPRAETPWPNQSRQLRDRLGPSASLIEAPTDAREERAFDWLEGILGT